MNPFTWKFCTRDIKFWFSKTDTQLELCVLVSPLSILIISCLLKNPLSHSLPFFWVSYYLFFFADIHIYTTSSHEFSGTSWQDCCLVLASSTCASIVKNFAWVSFNLFSMYCICIHTHFKYQIYISHDALGEIRIWYH